MSETIWRSGPHDHAWSLGYEKHIYEQTDGGCLYIIAKVFGGSTETACRRAALMTAAPKLLKALERLMGGDEKMQVIVGGNPDYVQEFFDETAALIKEVKAS